jgi:hypothetical protein
MIKMSEQKTKAKKVKVEKYNGFKVNTRMQSTRCIPHIYEMIKSANPTLLEREDVKKAFNDFVEFLIKYNDSFQSTKPTKHNKYTTGVKLKIKKDYLAELNFRFIYPQQSWNSESIKKFDECSNEFLKYYTPLYDLIKRDVIPYMEIKDWEIKSKNMIEYYHRLIEREEVDIKRYELYINQSRSRMGEYAEKALVYHNPPETTKFD